MLRGLGEAAALVLATALTAPGAQAITLGLTEDFQGGTTGGWGSGSANPNPPVLVTDGGPAGAGDAFLLVRGNGGDGAGSNVSVFHTGSWTGDYLDAGVSALAASVRNLGEVPLAVRLLLEGPGGSLLSAHPVSLAPGGAWLDAVFPIAPDALGGGVDPLATLRGVTKLRIVHAPTADGAEPVLGALGLDDLAAIGPGAAVPEPGARLVFAAGLVLVGAARRRRLSCRGGRPRPRPSARCCGTPRAPSRRGRAA